MSVVIFGSGNVAVNLAYVFKNKVGSQLHIHGRTETNVKFLADKFGASYSVKYEDIPGDFDLLIISVSDDALPEIVKDPKLKEKAANKLVVHTAGSVSMDILSSLSPNYGVFYPLQTFSKFKIADFKKIPLCLEASSGFNYDKLTKYAVQISEDIRRVTGEQRKYVHLAAVFANNFVNNMFAVSEKILKDHQIDFDILLPLIRETFDKITENKPSAVQTGPAVRKDQKITEKHIELLDGQETLKELYSLISKNIQEFNQDG